MSSGTVKFFVMFLAITASAQFAAAQQISRPELDLANTMLSEVSSDVQKNYYDSKLHGLDWPTLVRETREGIAKAPDGRVADAEIETLLEQLNDSHTHFIPPRNLVKVDYGWKFQIFGKRAFVTEVAPKSDAESKGMKPGDELLTINGFAIERASLPMLKYTMNVLTPMGSLTIDLRNPAGKIIHLNVMSTVKKTSDIPSFGSESWRSNQQRIDNEKAWDKAKASYKEFGLDLMILRVPAFFDNEVGIDELLAKANRHKALIMDLRGDPGGAVVSLREYLSDVFNHDVKIGQFIERGKSTPIEIKSNRHAFQGDLIVLIDSESASAAEIFARAVQLEKRGTIIGDLSSGQVMESQTFAHKYVANAIYYYGASVTVADTTMADGKSLEHVGVQPDKIMLPTAADLAAGRDPVLSYAAGLAGVTLSPEDAQKLFPKPSSDD